MPTFIPNRMTRTDPPIQAYIDTPNFIYSKWLNASGGINNAFFVSNNPENTVAVVGAGPAGCAAAFELQKSKPETPITLYQSPTDHNGGRCYSSHFEDSNGIATTDIAEMGAMRFAPTEETLFYYLNAFGIEASDTFPDPGVYSTWVYYKGTGQLWSNPNTVPNGFERVHNGWIDLATNGIADSNGVQLFEKPTVMQKYLQDPTQSNVAKSVQAWQAYLDEFGNDSFYKGLSKIFSAQHNPNQSIPGGEEWDEDDFSRFAALGIGSGGFGPLYNIGFNYIFRLVVNALESNQKFIPSGISSLCDQFISRFKDNGGNVVSERVLSVDVDDSEVSITTSSGTRSYVGGIIAMNTRSMEMLGISRPSNGVIVPADVAQAIDTTHVISSSKLFLRTKRFWQDSKYPRVLLTDTKLRQLYTLDYGETSDSGVVLVTYTWEDDSIKTQYFNAEARLKLLQEDIKEITAGTSFSDYADQLVPYGGMENLDNDLKMIDWQSEQDFFGAFTLARPGQDQYVETMFRDFIRTQGTGPLWIAGDCLSWAGGWVEGALHTGLNAAAAIAGNVFNGTFVSESYNPLAQLDKSPYTYFHNP